MKNDASTLHIVEPGGQGGVYQHVLGAIQNGVYRQHDKIILHTASDAELTPRLRGLEYCKCMRYQRKGPRLLRATVSLAWVCGIMLPHLARTAIGSAGHWEVQGLFGKGVYAILVGMPKAFGRHVTFVPHNSFSRSNSRVEPYLMSFAVKHASQVVVFVNSEKIKFPSARSLERRVLWQYIVDIDASTEQRWIARSGSQERPTLLFVGQLRPDKNPRLLLEAANLISKPLTIIFAGQDKGAAEDIRNYPLGGHHERLLIDEYLETKDFQSIIRMSDIVVCPYSIASQSGVISLADQLGKVVVASNVGGLAEQTEHTFEINGQMAAENLSKALLNVLEG